MSIFQSLREMHPYRLLVLAILATLVMAQVVAMVMVTRAQVQKAEAHYAPERATIAAGAPGNAAGKGAEVAPPGGSDGVMNVGYAASR